jgi:two-component system, chemotaxis family, protein-glutamate methylesterase/glutaminase
MAGSVLRASPRSRARAAANSSAKRKARPARRRLSARARSQIDPRPAEVHDGDRFDVVAMAASAGGLHALGVVLSSLPRDFRSPIVLVQHLDPRHRSLMADILARQTPLRVKQADEGDTLSSATVYIAPPDRHLLVNPDRTLSLSHSELVHFVRPSADLLFESVAACFQERAIAVVLTGTGTDAAMGVRAIKQKGGTVIVQQESTAEFPGMPAAAIQTGCADFVLPLDEIGDALVTLVMRGEAR